MKRLYYLADNIKSVESVSDELHRRGISDWNFHVMSKDKGGLQSRHLHMANRFLHERDGLRFAEQAVFIGIISVAMIALGVLILSANAHPEIRVFMMTTMIVVSALVGLIGFIFGSVYGYRYENAKISRFHEDIDNGKYLIMVDVKKQQAAEIKRLMSENFHDAIDAGEDETLVRPFQGRQVF